jgi:DNA polymerase-3 subunit epsilon
MQPLAAFTNTIQGKNFLESLVEKYKLCQKHCGLYKTDSSCFRYQTHRCMGACLGKEKPEAYNTRVEKALGRISLGSRSLALLDRGRTEAERTLVWVERGMYLGFGYIPADEPLHNLAELKGYVQSFPDNQDVQRILNHYLQTGKPERVWEW